MQSTFWPPTSIAPSWRSSQYEVIANLRRGRLRVVAVAQGFHILFQGASFRPSMVVNDLHIRRVALPPAKTDSPLVAYADAVLSLPFAFQGFQPVGRGNQQVSQLGGVIQQLEFPRGYALVAFRQFAGKYS